MPALRLAVFDMDGTLLDSLPDLAECCRALLAECDLPLLSDAQVRTMIGNGVQALVERALQASLAQKAEERGTVPVLALSPEEAVSRFMAAYTPRATRLSRLFCGAEEALRSLQEQNWTLAVCTNKPEQAARRILADFNLGSVFAAVGGGDSFVARKPDARHLLGTIAQAGGIAARSVMVGDMFPDSLAADGAGCPFVFARWGYGPPEVATSAVADAASMQDIPALLERVMPA